MLDTPVPDCLRYETWRWMTKDNLAKAAIYYWQKSFIHTTVACYTYHFAHISDFYWHQWHHHKDRSNE